MQLAKNIDKKKTFDAINNSYWGRIQFTITSFQDGSYKFEFDKYYWSTSAFDFVKEGDGLLEFKNTQELIEFFEGDLKMIEIEAERSNKKSEIEQYFKTFELIQKVYKEFGIETFS